MTPLTVYGVHAPDKAALKYQRIAGGTAEGLPFVPIIGMKGFLFFQKETENDTG